ncbi:MAG TPA: PKD domain-containing protein, partial [Bacteroidia bacterium]|nr:PKD domain-containing protein [Bacteroidia bacterium]
LPGTYTVTVTDANSCQVVLTGTVSSNSSTCAANFTHSQTAPNTISFTSTSIGTTSSTNYSWNYGDGNTGYGNPSSHIYSIPGTYHATLYISDSISGTCSSSHTDTVSVTGSVICNINAYTSVSNASCTACTDGMASLSIYSGGTAPFTYSWSAGTAPTNTTDFGLAPGSYSVTVTDSNHCQQTLAFSVSSRDTNCIAGFTKVQTAANTIQFTNTSQNVSGNTSYSWDYGDGTSTGYSFTATAPSHVYNVPGLYTVCLSITDSTNGNGPYCTGHFCDTVHVSGTVICNLSINVNTAGVTCSSCSDGSATAVLSGGTAPYSYSWSVGGPNTATHTGLAQGTYTVCAFDANGCHACQSFSITLPHCQAYFTLQADSLNAGDYLAFNYSSGTGPINCYWSWGDGGHDSVANPSHQYAAAGLYNICLTIFDSTGCSSTQCDTLSAARLPSWMANHHTTIRVFNRMTATGIKEQSALATWKLFPNPSSGEATVAYSLNDAANVTVELYDVSGRMAYQNKSLGMQDAGNHSLHLDCGTLQAGTYFVRMRANEHVETRLLNLIR